MGRKQNPTEENLIGLLEGLRGQARLTQEEAARLCGLPLSTFQWVLASKRVSKSQRKAMAAGMKKIQKVIRAKEA
jgi:hypothetical protein